MITPEKSIDEFASRAEYRQYKADLAARLLLAYGVVFGGTQLGRTQQWAQEVLNVDDDDIRVANVEARYNPRLKFDGRLGWGFRLTQGALPATAEEQQVIDVVHTLADGVSTTERAVEALASPLAVPNSTTAADAAWDAQMREYWTGRSA